MFSFIMSAVAFIVAFIVVFTVAFTFEGVFATRLESGKWTPAVAVLGGAILAGAGALAGAPAPLALAFWAGLLPVLWWGLSRATGGFGEGARAAVGGKAYENPHDLLRGEDPPVGGLAIGNGAVAGTVAAVWLAVGGFHGAAWVAAAVAIWCAAACATWLVATLAAKDEFFRGYWHQKDHQLREVGEELEGHTVWLEERRAQELALPRFGTPALDGATAPTHFGRLQAEVETLQEEAQEEKAQEEALVRF